MTFLRLAKTTTGTTRLTYVLHLLLATFSCMTLLWFFLCSEAEDLVSPPKAQSASPNRVAMPPASDTPLQLEATTTTPTAPKEKAMVMPDAPASSSRPSTWEEHVSHPPLFLMQKFYSHAYVFCCSLLVALWWRPARPFLRWSEKIMCSTMSLNLEPVSISTV